ncbi:bifunctional hydroxymethylpyrimidine kinase/phosphomethylpyrimidine kinase [Blastococcus mobilis]|uniref:bifunctional hydroxymethylpyrimidine kinase/phosphomethylpyrimidine kinase n=1 Tax=Blastococcus mobilis TaxID=1938746 RepID=UPI003F636994
MVWDGTSLHELRADRIDTVNNHGTGCTFASATAALLARGGSVQDALAAAKSFVTRAVAGSATWRLGHGHGALDHSGASWPVHASRSRCAIAAA